jgi:adenosine deaminase
MYLNAQHLLLDSPQPPVGGPLSTATPSFNRFSNLIGAQRGRNLNSLNLITLPKTELHLHLEGATPADVLLDLIHKYVGPEDIPDLDKLATRLIYTDFSHFLDTWRWMCRFVREAEDFTRIAEGVARQLKEQNVRYAECHFSPPDFLSQGLSISEIAMAVRAGLDTVGEPQVALIFDLCRQYGPEQGRRWLAEVVEIADEAGIVGVGLGGPEHLAPAGPYSVVFRQAENHGLRRVAHAGEAAGPESIWDALRSLGAERIGHATNAFIDYDLMCHLRDMAIPVEVCLTSNVCTGVVASIEEHPVRKFFEFGIPITLSSDDPTFFGTQIITEYQLLRDRFGFSDDELARVARTGFEAAFMTSQTRSAMLREFDDYYAKTQEQP